MSKKNGKGQVRGKQILLFGLVALVIAAGYYRWTIENENMSLAIPTANENVEVQQDENGENKEDAEKDNNQADKGQGEQISKLKQTRDSARSQSVDEWKKISENKESSQESKNDALKKIENATNNAEKERTIETQVISKGYDDCIAYVDDSGVSVTVQGGEVNGAKVSQIKDIIVSVTNVSVTNIKINSI